MTRTSMRIVASPVLALFCLTLLLAACGKHEASAPKHESFDTPEAAIAALVDAIEKGDEPGLVRLLGPESEDVLSSGDPVQDKSDRAGFVTAYKEAHSLLDAGPDTKTAVVGSTSWEMPIPVVKRDGRWYLDGDQGSDEMVRRRIGHNELGAIGVCRGFVEAQRDYASVGHDGDKAGIYALKLISDEGMQNGLYWPTAEGEESSPAGPFVAAAAAEGYHKSNTAYHGYQYRLLYKQGEHANGGAREYFKDGLLTEGFAMVAWPADYQVSGVMTFIVNEDGVVFQKDLGEDTQAIVAAMTAFDPDSSWVAVIEPPEA